MTIGHTRTVPGEGPKPLSRAPEVLQWQAPPGSPTRVPIRSNHGTQVLFPTVRFALFFCLVLPTSWLLMPRLGRWKAFVLVASFVFYGAWDWRYTFLLAASIV